jgi:hypothetical protein
MAMRRLREGLGYVCSQNAELREILPPDGVAALDQVIAAARVGEVPASLLDTLHEALLRAGDALGIYGRTRSSGSLAGLSSAPEETVYLCPSGRCNRYVWTRDVTNAPLCALASDAPMRWERLA